MIVRPQSSPRSGPGSQEAAQNDLSRVKSRTRLTAAQQNTHAGMWELTYSSAKQAPSGKLILRTCAEVARRVLRVCSQIRAEVGSGKRVPEKGRGASAKRSEMPCHAGTAWLAGAGGTTPLCVRISSSHRRRRQRRRHLRRRQRRRHLRRRQSRRHLRRVAAAAAAAAAATMSSLAALSLSSASIPPSTRTTTLKVRPAAI